LGFEKYISDDWNIFDFSMIVLSIFSSFVKSLFSAARSIKASKTSKLAKVTKLSKVLRMFKIMRVTKCFKFVLFAVEIINKVKLIFY